MLLLPFQRRVISNIKLIYMLPWLHPLSAFTSYELHGFTTLFLSERQKMVVLLPYNQITAAGFSMPFYHTSIKRDRSKVQKILCNFPVSITTLPTLSAPIPESFCSYGKKFYTLKH